MRQLVRKHIKRVASAAIGILLAFVLAEVAVRVFFPDSRDHIIPGRLFRMDSDLGWSFQGGKSGRHQTQSFDALYQINSMGYRDRERDLDKRPGTKRVLLYGDSQVFGWGLGREDRYSDLLEERASNVEYWNMAVPAYGLDQELLAFEQGPDAISPDIVMFFASRDTLGRTRFGYNFKKFKPQFVFDDDGEFVLVPTPETGRQASELLYRAVGWLYLPYFLELRLGALRAKTQPGDAPAAEAGQVSELNKRILLRANSAISARGARFVVLASLPEPKRQALRAFCKEQEIRFINLEMSGPVENWVHSKKDHHFNRRASKWIADQIEPQLSELLAPD